MPQKIKLYGNNGGYISKNDVIYFGVRNDLGYHLDDIFLYAIEHHYYPTEENHCRICASSTTARKYFKRRVKELNQIRCNPDRPDYLELINNEKEFGYSRASCRNPDSLTHPFYNFEIEIDVPTISEIINNINYSDYIGINAQFDTYNENNSKVTIVGYDIDDGDNITTLNQAAQKWIQTKKYIQLQPARNNRVDNKNHIPNGMRDKIFGTGKSVIDALRNYAIGRSPITEIYFSTHGVVYAIDLNTSLSNIYTSQSNMIELFGEKWNINSNGRYISHLKALYDRGYLSPSVIITIGACSTAAQVDNIANALNDAERPIGDIYRVPMSDALKKQYEAFVRINRNKRYPENFAHLLSRELPRATIIAPSVRTNAGRRGIEQPIMYQNGLRWNIFLPDHYLGFEGTDKLSWINGDMKTTLHPDMKL